MSRPQKETERFNSPENRQYLELVSDCAGLRGRGSFALRKHPSKNTASDPPRKPSSSSVC